MKKAMWVILILGCTSFGFAQEPKKETREVVLEEVTVTSPNFTYLNAVQDDQTPVRVRSLERKAASFDLKESPVYNNIEEVYEIFFSNQNGRIVAYYDDEGKILSSFEKFQDIVLPKSIRESVYEAYPDWKVNGNTYVVSYYKDRGVKKTYHFQVEKDRVKKNLKLTFDMLR